MGRPTVWVLLGLTLLVVSLHDVQVGAEVGPSESECRPYIEKAINDLKTVDSSDDSNENEIPDTSPEIDGDSKESGEVVNDNEQPTDESSEENNEASHVEFQNQENGEADGDSSESQEGNVDVTEQVDEIERESQENEDVTKSNEEDTDDNKSGEEETNDSGEATEEVNNTENENTSHEDEENSQEQPTENADEEVENEVEAGDEENQQSQEEGNSDNEPDSVSVEYDRDSGEIVSETAGDEINENKSEEVDENDKEGSDESTEGDQAAVDPNDDASQSQEENNNASAEELNQDENVDDNDNSEANTLDYESAETTELSPSEADSDNSHENEDASNEAAPEEITENSSEEKTADAEVNDSSENSNEEPAVEEEAVETERSIRNKRSIDENTNNSQEQSEEEAANSQEQSAEEAAKSQEQSAEEATNSQEQSDDQQASEESQEDNTTEENSKEEDKSSEEKTAEESEEAPIEQEVEAEVEAVEEVVKAAEAVPVAEAITKTAVEEVYPEDDLLMEFNIPENLRDKSHIIELLHLDDESIDKESAIQKVSDTVLRDLKRIYENAIKPLETLYKYRDLSNRHFGDPEIFSKPLVLFMGPWSGGKSSIINYLTDNEYTLNSLRTGAEPSPAYFNILMHGDEPEVLDGTQLAADWTFSGLQKFGQGLEDRLRGLKLPSKILEKVNIVEIPGILEVRKQVSRLFPFNDACQWFIDRADIIFLVYDPSKLDVGPETEAILDQLKGREYQTRILLNKADVVKPEELMRVQGALIWNISPLMSSAQPPVMYTTSLWSNPYTVGAPIRLLQAQERALLRDLRNAVEKRIENKIASARRFAVRVRNHAKMVDCYLTTYYNHKSLFGNKKQISDQIIEHPQNYHIYEGLSTLTNISRYDLPDPDVYRDFFRLNRLYEFKKLSETCTYFRGCPINKLDIAIAYDLPELVGKYKKAAEAAIIALESNAAAATDPKGKS